MFFLLLGDFNIDFCNHHHLLFSKFSGFAKCGGAALFISDKLEYQVTVSRPKDLEFLLVSVNSTNNVNEYGTGHLLILH